MEIDRHRQPVSRIAGKGALVPITEADKLRNSALAHVEQATWDIGNIVSGGCDDSKDTGNDPEEDIRYCAKLNEAFQKLLRVRKLLRPGDGS